MTVHHSHECIALAIIILVIPGLIRLLAYFAQKKAHTEADRRTQQDRLDP